jgi:hypothetical protein
LGLLNKKTGKSTIPTVKRTNPNRC